MFPTRTMGYIVGTATMVFSLVILALPVGVIGGNFSNAWAEFETEKIRGAQEREKDIKFITSAMQRTEPFEMSQLMLIEVWNERVPVLQRDRGEKVLGPLRECRIKPDCAEFMGHVHLHLGLRQDSPIGDGHPGHLQTLRLEPNAANTKRGVAGSITVQIDWKPQKDGPAPLEPIAPADGTIKENGATTEMQSLRGKLKVTIVAAENLINLSYKNHKRKCFSNPYAMVFCYPNSPVSGEAMTPSAWRTPAEENTLFPNWNAHHTWNYCWEQPAIDSPRPPPHGGSMAIHPEPGGGNSDGTEIKEFRDDEILNVLQRFGRDVQQLRDEVRTVSGRIFRRIESPMPVVEPFAPPRSDR
jgi:hypothetical protein